MKIYIAFALTVLSTHAFCQKEIKPGVIKPGATKPVIKAEKPIASDRKMTTKIPIATALKKVDILSPENEVSGKSVRQAISGYASPNELVTVTITPTIKSYPPSFYSGSGGAEAGETRTFEPVVQKVTADKDGKWKTAAVFFGIDDNQEDAVYKIEAKTANGRATQKVKNTTRATNAPVMITSNSDGGQAQLGSILIPKGKASSNSSVVVSVYIYANVSTKKKSGFFKQFIEYTTPVLNIVKTGETIAGAFNNRSDTKLKQYSILSQTVQADANGDWTAKGTMTWPPDLMGKGIMPFATTISARPSKNGSPYSHYNTHTVRLDLISK
jgi:hypothetical protein